MTETEKANLRLTFPTLTSIDLAENGSWRGDDGVGQGADLDVYPGRPMAKAKWYGRATLRGTWPIIVQVGPCQTAARATSELERAVANTADRLAKVVGRGACL